MEVEATAAACVSCTSVQLTQFAAFCRRVQLLMRCQEPWVCSLASVRYCCCFHIMAVCKLLLVAHLLAVTSLKTYQTGCAAHRLLHILACRLLLVARTPLRSRHQAACSSGAGPATGGWGWGLQPRISTVLLKWRCLAAMNAGRWQQLQQVWCHANRLHSAAAAAAAVDTVVECQRLVRRCCCFMKALGVEAGPINHGPV
jgi:hypothetical protein